MQKNRFSSNFWTHSVIIDVLIYYSQLDTKAAQEKVKQAKTDCGLPAFLKVPLQGRPAYCRVNIQITVLSVVSKLLLLLVIVKVKV